MSINTEDLIEVFYLRTHQTMLTHQFHPTYEHQHNAADHRRLLIRLIDDTSQLVATVGQTEQARRQPPKPRWRRWLTRHP